MIPEPLIKTIATELLKESLKKSASISRDLSANFKQIFNNGLENYLERHINNISYTKTIIHRSTPIYFYDIYFPLKIYVKRKKHETNSVNRVFWESNKVVIIGDAGSGKSTLVKHLFLNTVHEKFGIPIVIELRDLNSFPGTIVEYISEKILKNKLAQNSVILNRLLKEGGFIFFLDGYDELKSVNKSNTINALNEFIITYNSNRFLITSRPYTDIDYLPNFHSYQVAELEKSEISSFILKQLKGEEGRAREIIKTITTNKQKVIGAFLSNPLLLSLFIITHRNNPDIPDKKYIFYRRVIDVLFKEHDSHSKLGFEREFRLNFSQEKIEEILKIFSFITYLDSEFDFQKDYLNRQLNEVKNALSIDFKNADFLSDMKISLGLWTEDGPITSFAHRSLQEYFAALLLSSSSLNKKDLYANVRNVFSSEIHLTEVDNFMSLCEEMDERDFNSYVAIPTLTTLERRFQKKDDPYLALWNLCAYYTSDVEILLNNNEDNQGLPTYFHASKGHSLQRYFLDPIRMMLMEIVMTFFSLPKTIRFLVATKRSESTVLLFELNKPLKPEIRSLFTEFIKETNYLLRVQTFFKEQIQSKFAANEHNKQVNNSIIRLIKKQNK